jgi:hypothetical protein
MMTSKSRELGIETLVGEAALREAIKLVQLLDKKQRDYGCGNITAFGMLGVVVRLNDKLERLKNLTREGKLPVNESLDDTLRDIANYAIIGLLLRSKQWREGRVK